MKKSFIFIFVQVILLILFLAVSSNLGLVNNAEAQTCRALYQGCSSNSDCCSKKCGSNGLCAPDHPQGCAGNGYACMFDSDCCDKNRKCFASGNTRTCSLPPGGGGGSGSCNNNGKCEIGEGTNICPNDCGGIINPPPRNPTNTPTRTPTRTPTKIPTKTPTKAPTRTATPRPITPTNSPTPSQPPSQTYTISGYVFEDIDDNNTLSSSDERIQGAQISITGPRSYRATVTTNNSGYFSQTVPEYGSYSVSRLSPPGYTDKSSNPKSIYFNQIVGNGTAHNQVYFPLRGAINPSVSPTVQPTIPPPPSPSLTITAGVFIDRDSNGIWQEWDDLISNGELIIDYNGNEQFDPAEEAGPRTRVHLESLTESRIITNGYTSTNGKISFSNLNPGNYRLMYSEINSEFNESPRAYSGIIILNSNAESYLGLTVRTDQSEEDSALVSGRVVSNLSRTCTLDDSMPVPNILLTVYNTASQVRSWTDTTSTGGSYSITVSDYPENDHFINISNLGRYNLQCIILSDGRKINTTNPTYPVNFPNDSVINFVLNPDHPWFMTDIGSVRQPTITNRVPDGQSPTTPRSGGTSSVFYSTVGNSSLGSAQGVWTVDKEYGQAGVFNMSGNASYTFYVKRAQENGLRTENLPGCPEVGSCSNFNRPLSELDHQKIYHVNGDLNFNPSTSLLDSNSRVIILVNGNINLNKQVLVRDGNSLLILAAKKDINIAPSVGQSNPSSAGFDIQAILSAENNINLLSAENVSCPSISDLRLNIEGTLIANSDNPFGVDPTGGKLNNHRTLCDEDANHPTLFVKSRLSFVTALTDFYKISTGIWNEIEP